MSLGCCQEGSAIFSSDTVGKMDAPPRLSVLFRLVSPHYEELGRWGTQLKALKWKIFEGVAIIIPDGLR